MGVASGCGEQEVGVASGSGWNLWVWLLGVVLRRYIDFLILLIPTPLVSVLFGSSIPTSFFILLKYIYILMFSVRYGSQKSSLSLCNNNRATEILRSVFVFVPLQKSPCFFCCVFFYFIERCQKRCKEHRKNGAKNVEKTVQRT